MTIRIRKKDDKLYIITDSDALLVTLAEAQELLEKLKICLQKK